MADRSGAVTWRSRTLALAASATLALASAACRRAEPPVPGAVAGGRVALDLIAELPAATVSQESAVLDLGQAAARRHLIAGWSADEEDADGTFVWSLGPRSSFTFFATAATGVTLDLRCKPLVFEGAPDQTVSIALGGEPLAKIRMQHELDRYRVRVPAERIASGQNRVDLEFGYHRQPRTVIAGAEDARDLAVRCYEIELEGLGAAASARATGPHTSAPEGDAPADPAAAAEALDRLELPAGTAVSYYFEHASSAELIVDSLEAWGPGAGDVRLIVRSATAEAAPQTHRIDPSSAQRPLRLPLATEGPAVDRLELAAVAAGRGSRGGWLRRLLGLPLEASGLTLVRPAVHVPPEAGQRNNFGASDDPPTEARPTLARAPAGTRANVIIYLIDTLRADHLGTYGYPRPTSPNIDHFAKDAVVFENARAQSSWTRPAVVSVLTGLAPRRHGVNRREDALPGSVDTLAELLAAEGYGTAGFVTNGNAGPNFGLDQGFEEFRHLRESADTHERHRLSDHLNLWLFHWLESRPADDRPFFLYAHATDPHVPYTPPEPFRSRFAGNVDPEAGRLEHARAVIQGRLPPTEETRRDLVDLYDAEIAFNDHHFGRLIERLKELELYDASLIVLVADHGEEFLDHGGGEHGVPLYDEQPRVRSIVKFPRRGTNGKFPRRGTNGPSPGGREAGRRIAATVSQIDVVPTILDLLGIAPPALDGVSLLGASERASFAYLALSDRRMRSVTRKGWKLILDNSPAPRGEPLQLYRLEADQREATELAGQRPFERELLAQRMRRWELELAQGAQAVGEQADIPDELRRQLEALGYL